MRINGKISLSALFIILAVIKLTITGLTPIEMIVIVALLLTAGVLTHFAIVEAFLDDLDNIEDDNHE